MSYTIADKERKKLTEKMEKEKKKKYKQGTVPPTHLVVAFRELKNQGLYKKGATKEIIARNRLESKEKIESEFRDISKKADIDIETAEGLVGKRMLESGEEYLSAKLDVIEYLKERAKMNKREREETDYRQALNDKIGQFELEAHNLSIEKKIPISKARELLRKKIMEERG